MRSTTKISAVQLTHQKLGLGDLLDDGSETTLDVRPGDLLLSRRVCYGSLTLLVQRDNALQHADL